MREKDIHNIFKKTINIKTVRQWPLLFRRINTPNDSKAEQLYYTLIWYHNKINVRSILDIFWMPIYCKILRNKYIRLWQCCSVFFTIYYHRAHVSYVNIIIRIFSMTKTMCVDICSSLCCCETRTNWDYGENKCVLCL